MAKIAVFDSGFGSLSIIKSIQKITKSDLVYFADQKNFPYGNKKKSELRGIIDETILKLEQNFNPDIIIIASNTPSVLFSNYLTGKIFGVLPPITQAANITKTGNVGILATKSTIMSKELSNHIKKLAPHIRIKKIDATDLIEIVENGKFLTHQQSCKRIIQKTLEKKILEENIDVIMLSSTHLPFLLPILKEKFPEVQFLDPADKVAKAVKNKIKRSARNRLRIFTSSDPKKFQSYLRMLGVKNKVNFLP